MERGKGLLWLVFACGLTGLAAGAYTIEGTEDKVLAGSSLFVWLVLSYCMFQRKAWARWIVTLVLAAIGLYGTAVLSILVLLGAVEGRSLIALLVGIILLVNAGILIFSEGVGDFFAWVPSSDWSHPSPATPAAQKVQAFHRDELLYMTGTRKKMSRLARRVTVIFLALGWTVFVAGTSWEFYSIDASFRQEASKIQAETKQANDAAIANPLGGFFVIGFGLRAMILYAFFFIFFFTAGFATLIGGYLLLFVLPFLLTLPFVLPFVWRWRDPVQFLVLRPFNRDRITTPLAQFLRDQVAPFGHCYTLSDQKIRVPLHIRIPLLQGQLSFFNFRLRKIRRPRHIDKLVLGMGKHVRRNLNWCFSRTKLFPITCCDAGWRACVTRLVQTVDVIVVDLSSITGNIVWELELLRDTGALARTVFVVQESQSVEAQAEISEVLGVSKLSPILSYGPGSASTAGVAGARIADVLCREHPGRAPADETEGQN